VGVGGSGKTLALPLALAEEDADTAPVGGLKAEGNGGVEW